MTVERALYDAVNRAWQMYGGQGETDIEIIRPMRSYAAFNHKDANHKEIADALRKQGVEVVEIMQPLDLLARYRGQTVFIEVKRPGSRAKWTRPQLQFIADTRFPVCVATDAAAAWQVMHTGCGALMQLQKDRLAGFLLRNNERFFTPKEIADVLG